MVYGGKPSTGCYLCRRRKIKCDEGQPECRNCLVYGKPCPGYRPDTIFRNETRKVERLMKKSNSSDSNSSDSQAQTQAQAPDGVADGVADADAAPAQTQAQAQAESPSAGTIVSAKPETSGPITTTSGAGRKQEPSILSLYGMAASTWEERAICFFFDQFTTYDGSSIGVSHLGFLPDLYAHCLKHDGQEASTSASSCLRRAVDAAALMALRNETKAQFLAVRARNNYGMALRGLRKVLYSRAQAVKDETFASLAILSMFEDIAGERNGLSSSHRVGFELLMKLRGADQLGHQQGRDLFSFAYTHTHVEILALGDKPRFNTDWIIGQMDPLDPVHRLISVAARVCQIFLDASASTTSPEGVDPSKLFEWIDAGTTLDQELSEWSQTLPNDWLPLVTHSPTSEPLITYQALFLSVIWNYYRAMRIVLLRIMLELRQIRAFFLGPTPDDVEVFETIQEMISDVCRSIPYSLGDIDSLGNPIPSSVEGGPRIRAFHGYSLLWPLWYVLSCGLARPEQAEQIRGALYRFGSVLGIKLALRLAEYTPPAPHEQPFAPPMGYPFSF